MGIHLESEHADRDPRAKFRKPRRSAGTNPHDACCRNSAARDRNADYADDANRAVTNPGNVVSDEIISGCYL